MIPGAANRRHRLEELPIGLVPDVPEAAAVSAAPALAEVVVRRTDALAAISPDHRDRGNYLTPRLYPTSPFDAWETTTSSM
jgi:hypothetical protein